MWFFFTTSPRGISNLDDDDGDDDDGNFDNGDSGRFDFKGDETEEDKEDGISGVPAVLIEGSIRVCSLILSFSSWGCFSKTSSSP